MKQPKRKIHNRPKPEPEPPEPGSCFTATVCGRGTIARGFAATPEIAMIRAAQLAETSKRIGDRLLDPSE